MCKYYKLGLFSINWLMPSRSENPRRKRPVPTTSEDFMETVFLPGNLRVFSGNFRPFSNGKNRKGPEVTWKNPKISRREYCFHLPVISRFFLQDTVIFPAGSCSILCPESSPWTLFSIVMQILLVFIHLLFNISYLLFIITIDTWDIIIIITSHRLITRWGRLRLLLGSTCSQFLSSFSFYRRRYLHPFPSNILTNDVFSMVRMSHSRQLSR